MFIVIIFHFDSEKTFSKICASLNEVIEIINEHCNIDKEKIRDLYIKNIIEYGRIYFKKSAHENSLYFIEVIELN